MNINRDLKRKSVPELYPHWFAALADAGLSEGEVQRLRSSFERDDGLVYYEVSFVSGTTEYEYSIDPNTAAVLHVERENAYD